MSKARAGGGKTGHIDPIHIPQLPVDIQTDLEDAFTYYAKDTGFIN